MNQIFDVMLQKAPSVRTENLDKFAQYIQVALERNKINEFQASNIFDKLALPMDWRKNLFYRSDRRSVINFLKEQADATKVQKLIIRHFIKKAVEKGLSASFEDTGTDNDGKWILDPSKISKESDYLISINENKIRLEIKWIKAMRFLTPKIEDLTFASENNVHTLYFWSTVKPTDSYFPNARIGLLSPQDAAKMLLLPHQIFCKSGTDIPIYGNKKAVRVYQNSNPYISDYIRVYDDMENIPTEAYEF